jgi:hypothetical protein
MALNGLAQVIMASTVVALIAWLWAELGCKARSIRVTLGILQSILAIVAVFVLFDLRDAVREHYHRQFISELSQLVSDGNIDLFKQRIRDYFRDQGLEYNDLAPSNPNHSAVGSPPPAPRGSKPK